MPGGPCGQGQARSLLGPDNPQAKLIVVTQVDELYQTPVVPVVRGVLEAEPVLGVLAQCIGHISDGCMICSACSRYGYTWDECRPSVRFGNHFRHGGDNRCQVMPEALRIEDHSRYRVSPYSDRRSARCLVQDVLQMVPGFGEAVIVNCAHGKRSFSCGDVCKSTPLSCVRQVRDVPERSGLQRHRYPGKAPWP